jgi:hypothetical protein
MKRRGKRLYLACSAAAGRARSRVATVGLFDTLKLCIYQAFDFKREIAFGSAVRPWVERQPHENETPTPLSSNGQRQANTGFTARKPINRTSIF